MYVGLSCVIQHLQMKLRRNLAAQLRSSFNSYSIYIAGTQACAKTARGLLWSYRRFWRRRCLAHTQCVQTVRLPLAHPIPCFAISQIAWRRLYAPTLSSRQLPGSSGCPRQTEALHHAPRGMEVHSMPHALPARWNCQ